MFQKVKNFYDTPVGFGLSLFLLGMLAVLAYYLVFHPNELTFIGFLGIALVLGALSVNKGVALKRKQQREQGTAVSDKSGAS
jgi:hypothetical protein